MSGQTNPYLDATYSRAYDSLRNKLDSQFEAAGRYGSDAHQKVMEQAGSDLANQIYGGQYNADMARRMQGLQMASGLDQGAYQNLINQYQAGLIGQAQQQGAQDYNYDQTMQMINQYLNSVQQGKAAKPDIVPKVNPAVQTLGLLMQGAGTYAKIAGM